MLYLSVHFDYVDTMVKSEIPKKSEVESKETRKDRKRRQPENNYQSITPGMPLWKQLLIQYKVTPFLLLLN